MLPAGLPEFDGEDTQGLRQPGCEDIWVHPGEMAVYLGGLPGGVQSLLRASGRVQTDGQVAQRTWPTPVLRSGPTGRRRIRGERSRTCRRSVLERNECISCMRS